MLKERLANLKRVVITLDLILTAASLVIAYHLRDVLFRGYRPPLYPLSTYLWLLVVILPSWYFSLNLAGAYALEEPRSRRRVAWDIARGVSLGIGFYGAVTFLVRIYYVSRLFIGLFAITDFLLLTSARLVISAALEAYARKGVYWKAILIFGAGEKGRTLISTIQAHPEWGLHIVGCLDLDPAMAGKQVLGVPVLGSSSDLGNVLEKEVIDEVIFALPLDSLHEAIRLITVCEEVGVRSRILTDFYRPAIARMHFDEFQGIPMVSFSPTPIQHGMLFCKRVVDLLGSSIALALLVPVAILIALAVKLTTPGPILFIQERCGLNGRLFKLLKFRTMVRNAEELKSSLSPYNEMSGPVFKMRDDPRVTFVGRFLRRFSLDELPQLINVLKGDMSLVGPRPPTPDEVRKYDRWQRRRLSMKPGLTCLWQCSGRSRVDFDEWMKLDLEYIDRWSLGLDLKILLKTIPMVILGIGAR